MSASYEHLFSPLKIGSITVKNRYNVGGMGGRHHADDQNQRENHCKDFLHGYTPPFIY